ncbi:hypothetical protein TSTA_000680 [Talaromyces stipitatus ATCC 10500]|uniref:F-box domain-containing protein n=1 Tax=Talaromyces stipitatus (strain ATCC 10500 / CBS 375.48 / QM 6759 / NRRL 1006) TaxID=441959 RepID=B8MSV1_TALSN|nr:uncharacterized protein TSTA_000680 [Talaromyces stipitatus ATCC 10500]EED11994.1 hypothetical protein TSTA_000680 [Talaromyces stipitatus ATCC 10500]
MSLPGILRLPTEILVSIFEFQDLQAKWKDGGSIPNIRLTCRRFCALSSHLLIRSVYVDITKTETVDRLQSIAADAGLSKGVREVYLRVHFYHPWVAASFENFAAIWEFGRIAWGFIRRLDQTVADDASHHGLEEQSADSDVDALSPDRIRPNLVLQRAYKLYKAGYESQDRIMRNGGFKSVLSKTLSEFKDLRTVTIYDRELGNNYGPERLIRVPQEDHAGQETALVSVFTRPVVWEDAQWIQPTEEIWQGVPVELLVEIPIAIGKAKGIVVDHLAIEVTAAPDYTRLPTNAETLSSLSAAMESMDIFQLGFQPCCNGAWGPWTVDVDDDAVEGRRAESHAKFAAELQALDKYLGAMLDCKSIEYANISLGEFWIGAGVDSIRHAPTSLGTSWFHKPARIRCLRLFQVPLTTRDLERFVTNAMVDDEYEAEIHLHEVYLCNGTWKQFLDTLRTARRDNIKIGFSSLLGGGLDEMDQEVYSLVWGRFDGDESMVQQYIRGRIERNPLD